MKTDPRSVSLERKDPGPVSLELTLGRKLVPSLACYSPPPLVSRACSKMKFRTLPPMIPPPHTLLSFLGSTGVEPRTLCVLNKPLHLR